MNSNPFWCILYIYPASRQIVSRINLHMSMIESTAVGLVQRRIHKLSQILYTTTCRCIGMSIFLLLKNFFLITSISSQTAGKPPSVHTAAALFQKLCYENKDALSASIIVAGWDPTTGPSVYTIPIGGGSFRQPWAIGGKSKRLSNGFFRKRENAENNG